MSRFVGSNNNNNNNSSIQPSFLADGERRVLSGDDSEVRGSTSSEDSFEPVGHLRMLQRSTQDRRLRIPPRACSGLYATIVIVIGIVICCDIQFSQFSYLQVCLFLTCPGSATRGCVGRRRGCQGAGNAIPSSLAGSSPPHAPPGGAARACQK